ncbi:MAG: polysaccharide pyruvyl transferase family protein [Pseudomonadota bacterium]
MLHFYYRSAEGNFGDDLNPWLWARAAPGLLTGEIVAESCCPNDDVFVGIGSLFGLRLPVGRSLHFFSTGYAYFAPPEIQANWHVYCVRGPLTASALGLHSDTAIADGALLLSRYFDPAVPGHARRTPSFMPHHSTAEFYGTAWRDACASVGIEFIDPRAETEVILGQLARSSLVIAEAMHGAIVADVLGVPWVRVVTEHDRHEFKWQDWAQSVGVELKTFTLAVAGQYLRRRPGLQALVVRRAGPRALRMVLAKATPQLSDRRTLTSVTDRLEDAFGDMLREIQRPNC